MAITGVGVCRTFFRLCCNFAGK